MDPSRNPYTPGAGAQPTVLAGRDDELDQFAGTLTKLERGRSAQHTLIVGLRGVGKTVLLSEFHRVAERRGWVVVDHESSSSGDLIGTVARLAQEALITVAPPTTWERTARRMSAILRAFEVTYQFAGLGMRLEVPDPGTEEFVASGDPGRDITALLLALGEVVREREVPGVAFLFDELQFAPQEHLGAVVAGLHKLAQRQLPIALVAAGLPQTRSVLAQAATYSERMFQVRTVGPLRTSDSDEPARQAIAIPAGEEGVAIEDGALDLAVEFTDGYPYFLQVFGDRLWRLSEGAVITEADATRAIPLVRQDLDQGFFTFRADGLPDAQRRYLRAMAELGPGEHSSGAIATVLGLESSAPVGQTREALIRRGLIYSPRTGFAAFSVPQFDDYLRRYLELEEHRPRRRGS